jgi:hypothetical protein
MAEAGTYSAFRQLKPLEGDISRDMLAQEELGLRRREEKRVEDQLAQNKLDKADKAKQDLWDKYAKPLNNYDSGSKSLNEVQGRALLEAQKQYLPLMTTLQDPKASDADKLKATLKLNNIQQMPERMQAITKALTDRDAMIKKGITEGKLWDNPEYTKNFQEGFSNKNIVVDDDGNPTLLIKNEDGTTKIETYDQITKGFNSYDFTPKFDKDKELIEASTKLQPEVNIEDDGTWTKKTTAVNKEALKNYVDSQLFQSDGETPTDKLKSFAKEAGVSLSDKVGLKKIADGFANDIKLRVKGGVEKTKNYNNLEVSKEQRLIEKDRRDEEKENAKKPNESLGAENFTKTGVVKGNTPRKGSVLKNMNGAVAYNLKGSNLERDFGKKGAFERVTSLYQLPDGNIALEVDRVDGNTKVDDDGNVISSTTKKLYNSKNQANEVADFITKKINPKTKKYYRNIEEFKRDALGNASKKTKIDY